MSHPLPHWLSGLLAELRQVSADLLEPGLAPSAQVVAHLRSGGQGPMLGALLQMADEVTASGPRLLSEVSLDADGASGEWRRVWLPKGARPSMAPHELVRVDGRLLPTRWLRFEEGVRPNEAALRWLLHIASCLTERLQAHSVRLNRQMEEALLVRSGDSIWAHNDVHALRQHADEIQQRLVAVRHFDSMVQARHGRRLAASDRAPAPFPQQPTWTRLRRIARQLLNPEAQLGTLLSAMLAEPVAVADVPYLYQRWCGLQVVRSLERQGWRRQGDLVGALFLGGRVPFSSPGQVPMTLWIEPRISRATMALSGWGSAKPGDELTPDFLISVGLPGQRDAFILDATLSTGPDVIAHKAKYRDRIVGVDGLSVAGVPVLRRPMRAWAIAPFHASQCQLGDPEGHTGGVPLHPGQRSVQALDAWVGDITVHARSGRGVPTDATEARHGMAQAA